MALKRWSIPSFPTSALTELIEASIDKETISLSMLISNYSAETEAHIEIEHTDGVNLLFKWILDIPVTNSPFVLDSLIVLMPGDKILVSSSIPEVSVLLSGDEN